MLGFRFNCMSMPWTGFPCSVIFFRAAYLKLHRKKPIAEKPGTLIQMKPKPTHSSTSCSIYQLLRLRLTAPSLNRVGTSGKHRVDLSILVDLVFLMIHHFFLTKSENFHTASKDEGPMGFSP